MSNSILSNDSRLESLEVTKYLKIPSCTDEEIKKKTGREGEVKFNTTTNCLMIRSPKEWISLKSYETTKPSAPPPPYPTEDDKKSMRVKIDKTAIYVEFVEIIDSIIVQQINFLLDESLKLKRKIIINQRNSETLIPFLKNLNVTFTLENGNIHIENY
jgi:hypothetical protein